LGPWRWPAVLVLRLMYTTAQDDDRAAAPGDTYARFRDAVEERFTSSHRVEDCARQLGYSTRTLTRAAQAGSGLSAKAFIARRVTLEATRMLAHTDPSAAQIAAGLGFSSATNFGKFFVQHTGTRPGQVRGSLWSLSPLG
jgi:AraC-like DNA-binding protein